MWERTNHSRMMSLISESGLFALVLTSRKPEARVFRRWVTSEVLSSIRRTGTYGQQPTQDPAIEHSDIANIINRRPGIYIVIVDGKHRAMQHTNGGEIITLVTEAMSNMMAGSLISAEGSLKLMLSQTMFPGLDTQFELEALERAIAYGAGVARRYIATSHNRTAESAVPPVGLPH